MPEEHTLNVCNNKDHVITKLAETLEHCANEAIEARSIFLIGLSGGSMVKFISQALPQIKSDWSKWRFFFCDERIVDFENPESTYGLYKKSLIFKGEVANSVSHVPLEEEQFICINPELSAEEAAKDYIAKMSVYFPPDSIPRFDALLLGVGPDGHTASLFPGHRILEEESLWVCSINDSPKPPPSRITLTLPVINNARNCIFVACGADKGPILKRIIKQKEEGLPATRVKPEKGNLYWFMDKDAAEHL